jgi:serine/threonine-protein kinase HipA
VSRICRICLEDVPGEDDYHPRCVKHLFNTPKLPALDIEISKLHLAALEMVGHTSLSGIQKKIAVNVAPGRATLRVAAEGGRYILKPQTDTYPAVPENEHITTRLAQLAGIAVAPNGLVPLKDGTLAYVVKRFDRLPDGHKLRQEDFCQLAEKSPKEKYEGSGELCVRLLRKYATEPPIEILKLYRLLVFVWWSGNGDMHLKTFSLMAGENGIQRLTPAYDLLCTRLVIPKDKLALPVLGKNDNLQRGSWREFAEYCKLPERVVDRVLKKQTSILDEARRLIDRSFLPDDQKERYRTLLEERTAKLKSTRSV